MDLARVGDPRFLRVSVAVEAMLDILQRVRVLCATIEVIRGSSVCMCYLQPLRCLCSCGVSLSLSTVLTDVWAAIALVCVHRW